MNVAPHTPEPDDSIEAMSAGRRLRRSLARRYPRARKAYIWTRTKVRSGVGRFLRGIPKTGRTVAWTWRLVTSVRRHRLDPRLTVAVDVAAFWEPLTGIGWYLYRLLEQLSSRGDVSIQMFSPTIIYSADLAPPSVVLPKGQALQLLRYEVPRDQVLFAGLVTRLLRRLEPLLIAAHRSQVLFAPNYFLPRRFSLARGALVATIHDLGVRQVPWTLREATLKELNDRLDRTLEKAHQLITVSAAVRAELIRDGYRWPERVHVVRHGPGHLAAVTTSELPAGLPASFALHVGTIEPRKNVGNLLKCWRQLQKRLPTAPTLLLCGRYGWKTESIREEVEAGEREGWLRHLGYVSEEQLAALYQKARVVVFPSLYEGFGLPAVEAQWAGTPLVCSDLPVLREVAGEGALFAPADRPDLLAEAVIRVLGDPQLARELVDKGRTLTANLSWRRAAEETLAVWRLAITTT